jgi:hypothetical protein
MECKDIIIPDIEIISTKIVKFYNKDYKYNHYIHNHGNIF